MFGQNCTKIIAHNALITKKLHYISVNEIFDAAFWMLSVIYLVNTLFKQYAHRSDKESGGYSNCLRKQWFKTICRWKP